jgi:hypothetical protein
LIDITNLKIRGNFLRAVEEPDLFIVDPLIERSCTLCFFAQDSARLLHATPLWEKCAKTSALGEAIGTRWVTVWFLNAEK